MVGSLFSPQGGKELAPDVRVEHRWRCSRGVRVRDNAAVDEGRNEVVQERLYHRVGVAVLQRHHVQIEMSNG